MSEYEILNRALSFHTAVSTSSSFARTSQHARNRPELQKFNQIGEGLQGVIFEQVGQSPVLKKGRPGKDVKSSNLRHEYEMHCAVSTAFQLYSQLANDNIHVPQPLEFISKSEDDTSNNGLLAQPENKHCLARLYLGRANGPINQGKLSLRNFPLYLKSMEDLHMDVNEIASAMGKAYAMMHWGAAVTGDDVEYVLGTSAMQAETPGACRSGR
ncbi:uncharacterized protein N7484_007046 [Penicillium longicatenatum]|uniref:uncharacterized protein n=1 Tax=Penicillium longicatenatum TaxID=1561947 RepID=UPI002546EEAF|nr:uncharacterized protein N7484_007046 [Penicillium longicatenatum]KAJ5639184.1 hypothetical protein N7484_007046 [Penicillium longicatenatum]